MGKKPQKKIQQNHQKEPATKKLSAQKRNELNQLIDSLLKIGFQQANNVTEQWSQYIDIQAILDRVQLIENTLKVKGPKGNRIANIDTFCKWAKNYGAQFDGVKITEYPGYDLGLEATKDLKKNEIFITIPKKIIMSEESLSISLSPIVTEIPMFDSMNNVKLAFALLLEKINPDSFWKPYIDILPEKYTTVMYFNVNEMQELKGSNCLSAALNQCKSIARQYAFIYKCIQNVKTDQQNMAPGSAAFEILKDKFTYELYRWAVSTVMTRQNFIPSTAATATSSSSSTTNINGDENSSKANDSMPSLIPFWDLVNHKDGEVTSVYNITMDCLESSALSDYSKGEQIFMYYGHRSNADLLVHNGFIYPENKRDSVSIRLGLGNHDELHTEKSKLLDQLHIANNCELKVLQSPEYISSHLLAFVRIFNMNKDQLDHWINSDRAVDLLHIDCALETTLETKTWMFLLTRLSLLLRVFPTTLEDDELSLLNHQRGQAKLGHIKAMLLQYRIFEKKILWNALDYAKQRTKV